MMKYNIALLLAIVAVLTISNVQSVSPSRVRQRSVNLREHPSNVSLPPGLGKVTNLVGTCSPHCNKIQDYPRIRQNNCIDCCKKHGPTVPYLSGCKEAETPGAKVECYCSHYELKYPRGVAVEECETHCRFGTNDKPSKRKQHCFECCQVKAANVKAGYCSKSGFLGWTGTLGCYCVPEIKKPRKRGLSRYTPRDRNYRAVSFRRF